MFYRRRTTGSAFERTVGRRFAFLSPNTWTALGIVVTLVAAGAIIAGQFFVAAVLLAIGVALDLVDGAVARAAKRATVRGAYIDTIADRYVEGIIAVSLLFLVLPPLGVDSEIWIGAYLVGAFMTTYAKAAAKEKDLVTKELRGGLFERAERMIVLLLGLLAASLNPLYLTIALALLAVLTNISALQRMRIALG